MSQPSIVIDARELNPIVLTCSHCKGALAFDALKAGPVPAILHCPGCGEELPFAAGLVLAHRNFFAAIREGVAVRFHVAAI